MPITGPASYIPTTNEFLAHWDGVNTALGAGGPLVLPGGITLANLTTHRDTLATKQSEVEGEINDLEIARGDLETGKAGGITRLNQFNEKVRAFLGTTSYVRALPKVPTLTDGEGNFIPPCNDMDTLWTKINAAVGIPGFTPPLLLLDGYALATYQTDLATLKTQFRAVGQEEVQVRLKRGERGALEETIYPLLKSYRQVVPTFFAANSPLVATLPKLTPEPGSTPDAVSATGVWDAAAGQGKITWTASAAADLAQFEIRSSPGSSYSAEDESVIGNVGPTDPREFFTLHGLGAAGAVSVFKVYVITTTGNEKGSNVAQITRP